VVLLYFFKYSEISLVRRSLGQKKSCQISEADNVGSNMYMGKVCLIQKPILDCGDVRLQRYSGLQRSDYRGSTVAQ